VEIIYNKKHMKDLDAEVEEIPAKAALCYEKNKNIKLPFGVPYIGMGASYDAALTLFYLGKDILPYIASEYHSYIAKNAQPLGVFISQSGETSETLWAAEQFTEYIAITNHAESQLGRAEKAKQVFELHAGAEGFSSTKTYINTLITLYSGLGIDAKRAVDVLQERWAELKERAIKAAEQAAGYSDGKIISGRYVLGSGPNVGTARQAALVLSETTRLAWNGMPVAQYDHGPKETAENSVVVVLNSNGKEFRM
jgi:glutamine---fructose-6-phosphate transaminase (isomerizing)